MHKNNKARTINAYIMMSPFDGSAGEDLGGGGNSISSLKQSRHVVATALDDSDRAYLENLKKYHAILQKIAQAYDKYRNREDYDVKQEFIDVVSDHGVLFKGRSGREDSYVLTSGQKISIKVDDVRRMATAVKALNSAINNNPQLQRAPIRLYENYLMHFANKPKFDVFGKGKFEAKKFLHLNGKGFSQGSNRSKVETTRQPEPGVKVVAPVIKGGDKLCASQSFQGEANPQLATQHSKANHPIKFVFQKFACACKKGYDSVFGQKSPESTLTLS